MTFLTNLFRSKSKQKKFRKGEYKSYRGYLIEALYGHCNGVFKGLITQVGKTWCYERDLTTLKHKIDAAIRILPDHCENPWLVFPKTSS